MNCSSKQLNVIHDYDINVQKCKKIKLKSKKEVPLSPYTAEI